MKRKFVWLFISCLMVFSMILASCGTTETTGKQVEEDTGSSEVKITETETGGQVNEQTVESGYADPKEPKYGGIHYRIRTSDWNNWDYAAKSDMFVPSWVGEELLGGDWTKGPAGTNENDWTLGYGGFVNTLIGKIAESWEMPDGETLLYHIRPGISWWNKAPANGRELTADDIVWNIDRQFSSPKSYNYNAYTTTGKAPLSATAIDKYTVEVKVKPEWQGVMASVVGDHMWLICPDAIEANGGEPLTEWKGFIGTGPFMLDDYVFSSTITYTRNPNYWQMDPLHPENRLPYADGLKELIIPDSSTQQAAFRTGQVDFVASVHMTLGGWETVEQLKKENPELLVKEHQSSSFFSVWPRLDNPDIPFDNIKVRYAINMAINQQELLDDFYNGHAELLAWPYINAPTFSPIYTPLDQQSQIVQDIFGYDVERAKELMAEAGYPDGFKFKVDCTGGQADLLSILKEYLALINVDLEINALEFTVYMSEWMGGTYEQAFFASDYLVKPQNMMTMAPGGIYNYSRVNDPRIKEAYETVSQNTGINEDLVIKTLKEIGPYELEQAVPILLPQSHSFAMWWPWFQNFYGAVGGGGNANNDEYLQYFWIDTNMKREMGY